MNDIITDFSKNFERPQSEVSAAWDLAKEQAKNLYADTDEEYYPYVVSLVKNSIAGEQEQKNISGEQKTSLFSDPPETSKDMAPAGKSTFMTARHEAIKDMKFMEWKDRSNDKLAVVRFLLGEKLYIMEFVTTKEGDGTWNYEWNSLLKQGVNRILTVTIEQLNGSINNQKISANKSNICLENKEDVTKAMNLAFEEYFDKYNKMKDVQYLIFVTETEYRYAFLKEFSAKFSKKFPKFKETEEISKMLSKPNKRVIACRNSSAKLKEDGEGGDAGGTVTSSSFDAAPFDGGRSRKDWKKDWDSQKPKACKGKKKKKGKFYRLVDLSNKD